MTAAEGFTEALFSSCCMLLKYFFTIGLNNVVFDNNGTVFKIVYKKKNKIYFNNNRLFL